MIALGIHYLCGYSAATNLARQRSEWPVHPGRIFMAMVAAHYETGEDLTERAALEWMQLEAAPAIRAGTGFERTTVKTYVPVNDEHSKDVSSGLIPVRSRQDRTFPKIWLEDDTTYLIWSSEPPSAIREALERLCQKVTRIGHSSSLVQMWVVKRGEEPEPNWIPNENASERMRVSSPGLLRSLETAFNAVGFRRFEKLNQDLLDAKGKAKTTLKRQIEQEFPDGGPIWQRPQLAKWQGYSNDKETEASGRIVEGPFDPDIVVLAKVEGRTLGLEATLQLTSALRNAVMKAASQLNPIPEWLSGHTPDGSPSLQPHAAFFPLPYVGAEHADGHVMGMALALPREFERSTIETEEENIRKALAPLFFDVNTGQERSIRLWRTDGLWEWILERETRLRPPSALRNTTWVKPSRLWASVTPVVLHHHPKRSRLGDVERIVREAFVSALLPEPESLTVRSVSLLRGAGHERIMPRFDEGGIGMCQYQTHVVARFKELIRGPVLVGRGRYRGYGLFRPIDEREDQFNAPQFF